MITRLRQMFSRKEMPILEINYDQWEIVYDYNDYYNRDFREQMKRIKVFGGWIVNIHNINGNNKHMIFVSDKKHQWRLKEK